jgi:N-hydroxyarylamine O-acetyltransferase
MDRPDLDAYFQRIGCPGGPRATTIETLRTLHLHHAQAIAFENLDPLSGRPVKLDLPSLERKLVHEGRGGYCFEHNLLFSHVLQALGFRVTGLAARVTWNAPEGAPRPRSHMLLRVDLGDAIHIADVGFGGQTLTSPLRLVTDIVQATPHEPFRLIGQDGGDFILQTQLGNSWKSLYRFDLQPQLPVDYEAMSWYLSTFPQSYFVTNLMAARPAPGRRFGLFNNELTIHELHGNTEKRTLVSEAELHTALATYFGLHLSGDPAVEAALCSILDPLSPRGRR